MFLLKRQCKINCHSPKAVVQEINLIMSYNLIRRFSPATSRQFQFQSHFLFLSTSTQALANRSYICPPRSSNLSSHRSICKNALPARPLHTTSKCRSPTATTTAATTAEEYPTSHQRIESPLDTRNFIDNQFLPSKTSAWIDLYDPATNNLVTRVPQSTDAELRAAVESATKAFPSWKATSLLAKQQIMFKFVALIREHWDRLAASITLEQGKTFADAKGDVLRGLQVAETACGITTQLTGEVLEVAKDMETRSYKEPLGVVAAICPFSMPIAM